MKPKLLLNAGINHAATTPFYYTLSIDQKYCHAGHKKELHYLITTEKEWDIYVEKISKLHSYNTDDIKKPSVLNQWKWKLDAFEPPYTIEKYIQYQLKNWEHIKGDYQSVADFSNSNAAISEEHLKIVRDKLLEHFDVKCTVILRDPIRRMYSLSKRNSTFLDKLNNPKYDHIKHYQASLYCDYVGICKRWQDVWGARFMPVIMEEFWEDPFQLSDFLEYPITKVHENVFYPERGINFKKMDHLKDQWSVKEEMDENSLEVAKTMMSHIYQEFEEYFGYIPSSWQSW